MARTKAEPSAPTITIPKKEPNNPPRYQSNQTEIASSSTSQNEPFHDASCSLALPLASFETYPADIISLITKYLNTDDIVSLFLVGSRLLTDKLMSSTSSFCYHSPSAKHRVRYYPKSSMFQPFGVIQKFNGLRELILDLSQHDLDYDHFCAIPSTVTTLHLSFRDFKTSLRHNITTATTQSGLCRDFSLRFPMLKNLFFSTTHTMSNWPCLFVPSLESMILRFHIVPEIYDQPLPPNLTKLQVPSTMISSVCQLPRSLTELRLDEEQNLNLEEISYLPRNLTVLKFSITTMNVRALSSLPASLTQLTFNGDSLSDPQILSLLPSKLIELKISGCFPIDVSVLPGTIRKLQLDKASMDFNSSKILSLRSDSDSSSSSSSKPRSIFPESLTFLKWNWVDTVPDRPVSSLLSNLPPTLLHLDLGWTPLTSKNLLDLPPKLMTLCACAKFQDEDVLLLPRSLTKLVLHTTQFLHDFAWRLPPNLKFLVMDNRSRTFESNDIIGLPQSLEYLAIWNLKLSLPTAFTDPSLSPEELCELMISSFLDSLPAGLTLYTWFWFSRLRVRTSPILAKLDPWYQTNTDHRKSYNPSNRMQIQFF